MYYLLYKEPKELVGKVYGMPKYTTKKDTYRKYHRMASGGLEDVQRIRNLLEKHNFPFMSSFFLCTEEDYKELEHEVSTLDFSAGSDPDLEDLPMKEA